MNPYEGSASLAPEAQEKVLQTFRHTLQLVRDGRNEEALLGCDFILKMDARFAPAHRLLASLRGVPAGQRIDAAPFALYLEAPHVEAAPPVEGSPFDVESTSTASRSAMRPPSSGGLDDLVFDDLTPRTPAAVPGAPAATAAEISFAGVAGTSGVAPSVASAGFAIGSGIAPPAAAPPTPAHEDLDMSISTTQGSPGLSPGPPRQAPATPSPRPAPVPGPPSTSLDPRIMQFLKQGDDAMVRGNPQEAIDLWSRVFLIDLSNEEASRRIDQAREMLADSARKVDVLLAEGTQLYDAGNLSAARAKFLDVLALSEHDATARSYLKQIDAALAAPGAQDGAGGDSEFLRTEIEAPVPSSYADDNEGLDTSRTLAVVVPDDTEAPSEARVAPSPPKRRSPIQIDLRVLLPVALVVLVAIAGGAWWTFRGKSAGTRPVQAPAAAEPKARTAVAPAPAPGPATARPKPADEDPIARAQALFLQGKVDAATQVLLSVPDNDPRRNEALAKIDQYRNAGAPPPAPTAPNSTNLEQLRAQGLAAMKTSRYIDAFKALDPVVKAYPNDTEAARALLRAREAVDGLRAAVKSYSEGDYESAIKLLWELRRSDPKNQDVEEYLLNSYVNSGLQALQSGNNARATEALQDAAKIRPSDREVQRLLRFSRKYPKGPTDLMARIYVRHLSLRP
jgi:tetratricopeptide (TPR) repeat protein